jgi:hypothetical protein
MDENFAMGYAMGQDNGNGNCNGNGLFGGNDGWLGILLLIALLGGGLGWGGGFGGFGGGAGLQGMATRADINEGFALNNITSGITAIQQGICDATYAINNGLRDLGMNMMQGFNGVDRAVCDIGYAIKDCCCTTQRAIDGVNYNMATQTNALQTAMCTNTRDIIDSQQAGTRAILDFLTQDKISTLTAENQALKFQASQTAQNAFIAANQDAQTATLLRRLGADCPTPAYLVQPPTPVNFPTNGCGTVQFGYNGGCGCA